MVEFRDINKDNFHEVLQLKVTDEQRTYVSTVVESLAQAWDYRRTAYPFSIYGDTGLVGFIMLA